MMKFTRNTRSTNLTLTETLTRLAAAPSVLGLALFGSQARPVNNAVSDYDLLLLVRKLPVDIYQMLTHIDGRMADLVFIPVEIATRTLASETPAAPGTFEGMFLLKMLQAEIVYDPSGQLVQVQQKVKGYAEKPDWLPASSYSKLYDAWFWQNHGLFHMKRMIQSSDPAYLTAVDLMLVSNLGQICRAYYSVRNLPWEGEKAAVRYLEGQDPSFLSTLRSCIAAIDRRRKLELYERLVVETLSPVGGLWEPGITSVYLSNPEQHETHAVTALAYWELLLETEGQVTAG